MCMAVAGFVATGAVAQEKAKGKAKTECCAKKADCKKEKSECTKKADCKKQKGECPKADVKAAKKITPAEKVK